MPGVKRKLYMKEISNNILSKFNEVLSHKITIKDFEEWVYESKELETELSEDVYMDLLSLNYKSKYIYNDLEKIIDSSFGWGKLKANKIKHLLRSIIARDENCAESIQTIYHLYYAGCDFFQKLGLRYGEKIAYPPFDNYDSSWHELSSEQQQEILGEIYPDIIQDTRNALGWIENGKIIFYDQLNHYEYDDLRNPKERKEGNIPVVTFEDVQEVDSQNSNEQISSHLVPRLSLWERMRNWLYELLMG